VFGALCGKPWSRASEDFAYYGKGDNTEVFRFDESGKLEIFGWCREGNSLFQFSSSTSLGLGGGGPPAAGSPGC
jgi:hypothetical protein